MLCRDCFFWEWAEGENREMLSSESSFDYLAGWGVCHRLPPTLCEDNEHHHCSVDWNDWCGEWRPANRRRSDGIAGILEKHDALDRHGAGEGDDAGDRGPAVGSSGTSGGVEEEPG